MAKREVFAWIKNGEKTIDVRRGKALRGEFAVFQCGPKYLKLWIVERETGKLEDVVRWDNFKLVIPSAETLDSALGYLRGIYEGNDGIFTAYHLAPKA